MTMKMSCVTCGASSPETDDVWEVVAWDAGHGHGTAVAPADIFKRAWHQADDNPKYTGSRVEFALNALRASGHLVDPNLPPCTVELTPAQVEDALAAPEEPAEQAWLVLLMPDSGAHKTREWRGVSASEDDAIERAMSDNPGWSVHTFGPDVTAAADERARDGGSFADRLAQQGVDAVEAQKRADKQALALVEAAAIAIHDLSQDDPFTEYHPSWREARRAEARAALAGAAQAAGDGSELVRKMQDELEYRARTAAALAKQGHPIDGHVRDGRARIGELAALAATAEARLERGADE